MAMTKDEITGSKMFRVKNEEELSNVLKKVTPLVDEGIATIDILYNPKVTLRYQVNVFYKLDFEDLENVSSRGELRSYFKGLLKEVQEEDWRKELAKEIKERRTLRGYSVKELAALLNVEENTVYNWEKGVTSPIWYDQLEPVLGINLARYRYRVH